MRMGVGELKVQGAEKLFQGEFIYGNEVETHDQYDSRDKKGNLDLNIHL